MVVLLTLVIVVAASGSRRRPKWPRSGIESTPTPSAEAVDPAAQAKLSKAVADILDFSRRNPAAFGQRIERCTNLLAGYPEVARIGFPTPALNLLAQAEAELKRAQSERRDAASRRTEETQRAGRRALQGA